MNIVKHNFVSVKLGCSLCACGTADSFKPILSVEQKSGLDIVLKLGIGNCVCVYGCDEFQLMTTSLPSKFWFVTVYTVVQ